MRPGRSTTSRSRCSGRSPTSSPSARSCGAVGSGAGESPEQPGGLRVQDRGLAAYFAELVGTLLLTFAVCTVVVLYVATSANAQSGFDFVVVGLVHGFVLFGLIIT